MSKNLNKYKKVLSVAGIALASTVMLTACSGNKLSDVATYKGGKVSGQDAYSALKFNQQNQAIVKNLAILDVYNSAYGDKISDSKVNDVLKKYKSNYESDSKFEEALKTSGYTEKTFKEYLKKQLAYEYGVKKNMKVTDAEIKAEWEKYQPNQNVKLMVFTDENAAKEAKDKLNNNEDFDKVASEKSASKKTDYTMNYTDTVVPDNIKEAIYKLNDNDTTDVLTYEDQTSGQKIYYIAKMVKKQDKPKSMDKVKNDLIDTIKATNFANGTGVDAIVRQELAKQNFKVMDDDYKSAFSALIEGKTTDATKQTDQSSSTGQVNN
jgi:foldase protein prsA